MRRVPALSGLFALVIAAGGCGAGPAVGPDGTPLAAGLEALGPERLRGPADLWREVSPDAGAGLVRVVVEIPAGTTAKWQVDHVTGELEWEREAGQRRTVAYLGYPGNYGIVPQTLLPDEDGGDGDPLDVLVLGPAVPRGEQVVVRLLGVLRMRDTGEADDKLIAVPTDGPFAQARTLEELDAAHPGVLVIVAIWFANYKGPGRIEQDGYGSRDEAEAILSRALEAFEAYEGLHGP